jgi:hypothetical protein
MKKGKLTVILILLLPVPALLTMWSNKVLGPDVSMRLVVALWLGIVLPPLLSLCWGYRFKRIPAIPIQIITFGVGVIGGWSLLAVKGASLSLGPVLTASVTAAMASIAAFAVGGSQCFYADLPMDRKKWLRLAWFASIISITNGLQLLGVPWRSSTSLIVMLGAYLLIIDPLLCSKDAK